MANTTIPLQRTAIGLIALSCLTGALAMTPWAMDSSSLSMFQGGLARGGLLAAAVWLALPGRHREAAWANISPKTLAGLLIGLIVTIRVPLKFLIPAAAVLGLTFIILRPRPKKRPSQSAMR